jgi:TonB family protein
MLLIGRAPAFTQSHKSDLPHSIVIARETYFDVGPPFNFYEVLTVDESKDGLTVERAVISPSGDACFQPPTVEIQSAKLQSSMASLLRDKNPCEIPEKVLNKEAKRCKHCLNFAGSNVTMHVSCQGKDRQIKTNVLEKDWFDKNPNTPEQTSWGMPILHDLDSALGPGVMEKPIFTTTDATSSSATKEQLNSSIAQALQGGKYDYLFDSKQSLSEMFRESLQPPRSPMVALVSASPISPSSSGLPKYPPIGRAAHVSGKVTVSFEVTQTGQIENLTFISGPKMMQGSVEEALKKWTFPASTDSHHEEVVFNFNLNCAEILVRASSSQQQ